MNSQKSVALRILMMIFLPMTFLPMKYQYSRRKVLPVTSRICDGAKNRICGTAVTSRRRFFHENFTLVRTRDVVTVIYRRHVTSWFRRRSVGDEDVEDSVEENDGDAVQRAVRSEHGDGEMNVRHPLPVPVWIGITSCKTPSLVLFFIFAIHIFTQVLLYEGILVNLLNFITTDFFTLIQIVWINFSYPMVCTSWSWYERTTNREPANTRYESCWERTILRANTPPLWRALPETRRT